MEPHYTGKEREARVKLRSEQLDMSKVGNITELRMVRHGASPLFAFQIFQIFVVLQTKLLEGGAHVLDIETQFSVGQSFAFCGFLGQSLPTCTFPVLA
jgi:hypothetical protein